MTGNESLGLHILIFIIHFTIISFLLRADFPDPHLLPAFLSFTFSILDFCIGNKPKMANPEVLLPFLFIFCLVFLIFLDRYRTDRYDILRTKAQNAESIK